MREKPALGLGLIKIFFSFVIKPCRIKNVKSNYFKIVNSNKESLKNLNLKSQPSPNLLYVANLDVIIS